MAKKKPTTLSFSDKMTKVFSTFKSETIHVGFSKINLWASCGNFALNRMLSNDYEKAFLFGRTAVIYGESGSGKTLLVANTCGLAQKVLGAFIVWVDTEGATDDDAGQEWLKDAGIDIDNNFQYIRCATINEAQKIVSDTIRAYRIAKNDGDEDLPPLIFVFDSLSALLTESQHEQALKGELKGDQGQKAKQLGDFILRTNHLLAGLPILMLGILHVYQSQEQYGDRFKITGGLKVVFMASTALMFSKYELRQEDTEDKTVKDEYDDKKDVVGMNCQAKILKSRFSKPFEKIWIQVPYLTGIDPYSGLFSLLEEDDFITSPANGWYQFTRTDGSVVKFQKSGFRKYADEIMKMPVQKIRGKGVDLTPPEIKVDIDELEGEEDPLPTEE